jgi:hypothetical protein
VNHLRGRGTPDIKNGQEEEVSPELKQLLGESLLHFKKG